MWGFSEVTSISEELSSASIFFVFALIPTTQLRENDLKSYDRRVQYLQPSAKR